ncbi:MAG: hypothetical protein M1832_004106 [Thelocarpon impressellum]|nr:MAG: hypothetical protein M1832_004106 [Thelocarpon impressellum]
MAPPAKRRKTSSAVEVISFDFDARSEYLTGFHKRKLQRIKHAQEEAAKKERIERLEQRKKLREERKEEVRTHVETVNALLRGADGGAVGGSEDGSEPHDPPEDEEWTGIEEPPAVDHEDEYVDEDRYTTVTVESVGVSKEGLHKVAEDGDAADQDGQDGERRSKKVWIKDKPTKAKAKPKTKKKKFRYESKVERKSTRGKERAGNKAKASARRT